MCFWFLFLSKLQLCLSLWWYCSSINCMPKMIFYSITCNDILCRVNRLNSLGHFLSETPTAILLSRKNLFWKSEIHKLTADLRSGFYQYITCTFLIYWGLLIGNGFWTTCLEGDFVFIYLKICLYIYIYIYIFYFLFIYFSIYSFI